MKKKLFLISLMVALLVCLFIISVNAAGFESEFTKEVTKLYAEDGTTELTPDWADVADKTATAVLKKADETYIRIPLYYIYQTNGSTELRHEIRTAKGSAGFRYDWIGAQLGETFTHANLVALDIPEGIKKTSGLNNYTALKEVIFPLTAADFPKSEKHPALEKVFAKQTIEADGTVKGITTVSNYAFKSVKTLEYFKLELDYATYVGSNAFLGSSVKELRFEGPFTGMGGSPFGSCTALETVYINNTSDKIFVCDQGFKGASSLRSVITNGISFNNYTFENVNALTSGGLVVVATNVGDIGNMAFKNTKNLSSVTLSGVTSMGSSVFLNCINLKTADISGPITSIGGSIYSGCSGLESTLIRVTGNTFSDKTSVGGVSSIVSKDVYEKDMSSYATGNHIVYGYNLCELLYDGVHQFSENYELVFTDFVTQFNEYSVCTKCGVESKVNENDYAPIFVFAGYSVKENDNTALCGGYTVNHKSLEVYKKYNSNISLEYGMVAATPNADGSNLLKIGENGVEAAQGRTNIIIANVNMDYVGYDFILRGFDEEGGNSDTALIICSYLTDGTNIYYLTKTCSSTVPAAITMTEIRKKQQKDTE